jgi:hypothetical protein
VAGLDSPFRTGGSRPAVLGLAELISLFRVWNSLDYRFFCQRLGFRVISFTILKLGAEV